MTYKAFVTNVLSLINQYSIAGNNIQPEYNNQKDYLKRIPALADNAQVLIATTAKPIPADVPVTDLHRVRIGDGNIYRYYMPRDFHKFKKYSLTDIGVYPPIEIPLSGYLTDGSFIYKDVTSDSIHIQYYRLPATLGENPPDDMELDNTEEVQRAAAYYVAAQLIMYDDAYNHSALYNEYETRISRLSPDIVTEVYIVEDVYNAEHGV